jgi:hypothetical protein
MARYGIGALPSRGQKKGLSTTARPKKRKDNDWHRMRENARGVLAAMLAGLSACSHAIVMQDPKTGMIARCDHTSWAWGSVGEIVANNKCAEGYERAGWQRMN